MKTLPHHIYKKLQPRQIALPLLFIMYFFCIQFTSAELRKVRIYGYVIDTDNRGIEYANVYAKGSTIGTTTNKNGYYDLQLETNDSITIVYSMLGYKTIEHTFLPDQRVIQISVELQSEATALSGVEIRAHHKQIGTMERMEAEQVRMVPDATGGSIESLLITFAGVSQTNELSSQYSVRGGNFDENSVYVNGIEVYRPLLIRSGQQEGLSFVNPEMVSNVSFSAGGYDAKYGDKMSSVLDITYKKPKEFEASASISLLGASAYVGTGNKRFTQMHGIRYKTAQYLLGTLDTQGEYKPWFVDYQTYMTGKISEKWELSFLGNFSQNSYRFIPTERETTFGTYQMARKLMIYFNGQESDRFQTAFGAFGATYKPNKKLNIGFNLSGFYTNEQETYDITGEYLLSEQEATTEEENKEGALLGVGTYHEHARNQLNAAVITLSHNGNYKSGNNQLSWGISAQSEMIQDQISEWEWRDSVGYSLPTTNPNVVDLYYSMKGTNQLSSFRFQGYVQDSHKWITEAGTISLTGGIRGNYWTFNKEFLLSPRASISYLPGWKRDFGFRLATGIYYQSPFYKEMRDTITDSYGVTSVTLNHDIKAQRSVHVVLGGDYYFRAWGRPFKFTSELYYKYMDRVISYTVDNVRVRYSGENDARAYTAGIDFKLYGELVPGADSWISLSLMQSKEDLLNDNLGWLPRPNEQRYNFSMFFQDYLPNNPKYKLHLRFIWADGLPFGAPRNPSFRSVFRMPAYRRVDIGGSRVLMSDTDKFMQKPWARHIESFWIHAEIFNLLNFKNVNSYYWVTDVYNQQLAVPNYLTGIMFNVRLTIDLK